MNRAASTAAQSGYITYDDAYSPPKTVEQARKLVESDEIDVLFSPLGAPTNAAIMKFHEPEEDPASLHRLGCNQVRRLQEFPVHHGFPSPAIRSRGGHSRNMCSRPNPMPRIGIVYQNDDFGRDVLKGFKDGLGAKVSAIVAELSYETADPTIDSQVVQCKSAGATVFMSMTTPKFAAQGIKKVAELDWRPAHYIGNNASSAGSTLKAAGFDISKGIISSGLSEGIPSTLPGTTILPSGNGGTFSTNTIRRRPRTTSMPPLAISSARSWFRCSSSAATTYRLKTSESRPRTSGMSNPTCCCRASRSIPRRPIITRSSSCNSCASPANRYETIGRSSTAVSRRCDLPRNCGFGAHEMAVADLP